MFPPSHATVFFNCSSCENIAWGRGAFRAGRLTGSHSLFFLPLSHSFLWGWVCHRKKGAASEYPCPMFTYINIYMCVVFGYTSDNNSWPSLSVCWMPGMVLSMCISWFNPLNTPMTLVVLLLFVSPLTMCYKSFCLIHRTYLSLKANQMVWFQHIP